MDTTPSIAAAAGYRHHVDPFGGAARPRDLLDRLAGARSVLFFVLDTHTDTRGALVEVWRESWAAPVPEDCGRDNHPGRVRQAYLSTTYPDVVKGWHLHLRQTDRFVCVAGRVIVALFDVAGAVRHEDGARPRVRVCSLDPTHGPTTLVIPPGTAHGWYCPPDSPPATVLNLCSEEYDGTDEYRRDPALGPFDGIPFDWRARTDG